MANTYDAIIIGGGHNGLVCGAYFARDGARTVVLEARGKTGGAADTLFFTPSCQTTSVGWSRPRLANSRICSAEKGPNVLPSLPM